MQFNGVACSLRWIAADGNARFLVLKSQIRISKSETRTNTENTKAQNQQSQAKPQALGFILFEPLNLFRVSDFVLRISG
jgi:hypothetical protein